MNEYLIKKLKEARSASNLKQSEVASRLGIKGNTLSNYENGVSEPDIDTFCALCDIYNLDPADILGEAYGLGIQGSNFTIKPSEINHIEKYRDLDDHGRESVDIILDRESQRVEAIRKLQLQLSSCMAELTKATTPRRIISYYQKLASAGSGEYLFDSIPTDTIEVPITAVSEQADFVIGINGISMEPTYYDGDRVYVSISTEISTGSIGVFTKGNECYIKELGQDKLISHNKECPDILDTDEIKLVGKVLGKVEEE